MPPPPGSPQVSSRLSPPLHAYPVAIAFQDTHSPVSQRTSHGHSRCSLSTHVCLFIDGTYRVMAELGTLYFLGCPRKWGAVAGPRPGSVESNEATISGGTKMMPLAEPVQEVAPRSLACLRPTPSWAATHLRSVPMDVPVLRVPSGCMEDWPCSPSILLFSLDLLSLPGHVRSPAVDLHTLFACP